MYFILVSQVALSPMRSAENRLPLLRGVGGFSIFAALKEEIALLPRTLV